MKLDNYSQIHIAALDGSRWWVLETKFCGWEESVNWMCGQLKFADDAIYASSMYNRTGEEKFFKIDSHGLKAVVLSSSLKIRFISVLKSGVFRSE